MTVSRVSTSLAPVVRTGSKKSLMIHGHSSPSTTKTFGTQYRTTTASRFPIQPTDAPIQTIRVRISAANTRRRSVPLHSANCVRPVRIPLRAIQRRRRVRRAPKGRIVQWVPPPSNHVRSGIIVRRPRSRLSARPEVIVRWAQPHIYRASQVTTVRRNRSPSRIVPPATTVHRVQTTDRGVLSKRCVPPETIVRCVRLHLARV